MVQGKVGCVEERNFEEEDSRWSPYVEVLYPSWEHQDVNSRSSDFPMSCLNQFHLDFDLSKSYEIQMNLEICQTSYKTWIQMISLE
jgi:hypothetical protein